MTKRKPAPLEIVYRPIDSLKPDPRNSNTHPPEQIEQLRASIRDYGFNKPILLKDDGEMIGAGHGAWEAAQLEGLKEVPTVTIRGLSEEKWRAYAIADNRIARNSTWNIEVLVGELNALQVQGFDLGEMGFSSLELGTMGVTGFTLEEKLAKADEEIPLPPKPVVKPGELWILGDHRLLIGDSTKADDVARLLQGGVSGSPPHLMVTDPPYGVKYNPGWRNEAYRAGPMNRTIGAKAVGKVQNDDRADWTETWRLSPAEVCYVWQGDKQISGMEVQLNSVGFITRNLIVWNKSIGVISRGDYHPKHETCWYMVRKGKTGHWAGGRKQHTVWDIDKPHTSETGHGTQKPVDCMRRPIINNSKPGDGVYDPFVGSGTTLIAAQMEGRRCFAMEIDPQYGQLVIERWEKFAGQVAAREDGKALADLKKGKK
jgi:DNA modification methylase